VQGGWGEKVSRGKRGWRTEKVGRGGAQEKKVEVEWGETGGGY